MGNHIIDSIAQEYEVVLIDDSLIGPGILRDTYDFQQNLNLGSSSISEKTEHLAQLIRNVATNPNIQTGAQVIEELKRYSEIVNKKHEYHKKRAKGRKSPRVGKKSSRVLKKVSREELDDAMADCEDLKAYANNVFRLRQMLKDRILDQEDLVLAEEVKGLEYLRKNKSVYKCDISRTRNFDISSRENIAIIAYIQAQHENKDVAIISNKHRLKELIAACYKKDVFRALPNGKIDFYSARTKREPCLLFDKEHLM